MSPVLERLCTLCLLQLLGTLCLLHLVFLGEVSFAVTDDLSHMLDILIGVLVLVLLWITLQYVDNLASAFMACSSGNRLSARESLLDQGKATYRQSRPLMNHSSTQKRSSRLT